MISLLPQYLYELGKGVRQLFMLTMTPREAQAVQARLDRDGIAFYRQRVSEEKVNLYFGNAQFVAVAQRLAIRPVCQLSAEEDFILGTLLGYETIVKGDGAMTVGQGPVRTGITAILPLGHDGVGAGDRDGDVSRQRACRNRQRRLAVVTNDGATSGSDSGGPAAHRYGVVFFRASAGDAHAQQQPTQFHANDANTAVR
mgnify:CR=1 FL=1